MLDTKAAEDGKLVKSSSTVESREQVLQNPGTEELDISEVFKLEAGSDDNDGNGCSDGDKQTCTETEGNFEPEGRDEVKLEEEKGKEPGEILVRSFNEEGLQVVSNSFENVTETSQNENNGKDDFGKEMLQVPKSFQLVAERDLIKTENSKERVLSETEQNHIISSLAKSVQLISQLETSKGQILSCEVCGFSTSEKQQRHELRIHHESVHYICKLCGNFHLSQSDLKLHLENTHIEKSKYLLCGIGGCGQKENIKWKGGEMKLKFGKLYSHVRQKHCTFKYSCVICDMQFTVVEALRTHVSVQHNGGTTAKTCYLKCPHCYKEVKYARNLQKHINFKHTPQKCDTCEFVTETVEKLKKHVKIVHLNEPVQCSLCDFESKSPEMLTKHIKNHHTKSHLCRYCSYKTNKTHHLWRHELTHSDVADYKCDKCDFKTKTPYSLKTHSLYHAESPNFVCDRCQYTSYNSANFSTHKKTKHGTGTNQHKCDQCGDSFQYLRHRIRHQKSHQTAKFDCKMCQKQFSRRDKLKEHGRKEHVLDEENEVKVLTKSISCAECGKLFTHSKHLSRHKASAHDGFVFNCLSCLKSFSRKDRMNTHELRLQTETAKYCF